VVKELLNAGFEVDALDHLIFLELNGLMQERQLHKDHKELEPPRAWQEQQLRRHIKQHRDEWFALELKEREQLVQVSTYDSYIYTLEDSKGKQGDGSIIHRTIQHILRSFWLDGLLQRSVGFFPRRTSGQDWRSRSAGQSWSATFGE
jgi:hypothetical protein